MTDKATGEVFPIGLYTIFCVPVIAVLLWLGWLLVKRREAAAPGVPASASEAESVDVNA
jgi:L-asparagine permease